MRTAILIGIFFFGLIVFHLLERVAPIIPRSRTGVRRRGYLADVIAAGINGPGLSALTKVAAAGLVMYLPALSDGMADWAWWAQFGVFFLVNDFGRYWLHRWYHASPLLWRAHRVHHTVVEMDALSTFRVHILEAVIKYGVLAIPFRLLGVDRWVVFAYSAIDILKGFWHHANVRTYIGPLNHVFNSGELHWWHHSTEARGQQANFGSVLSVWDRLFGTFYWPRGEWPKTIGVEGMEAFPDGYLGQLASVRMNDAEVVRAAQPATGFPVAPASDAGPAASSR